MIQELWDFIKNPVYEEDDTSDTKFRLIFFFKIVVLSIGISIVLGGFIGVLETLFDLDFGEHASEKMLEKYPAWGIFILAVIAAPLLEELVFRAPMSLFRNTSYFKYIFYALTLVFGFYHISNFEMNTTVLLLAPVLVAPQISVGAFLGYIRIRFGLLWAMALHAAYNFVLIVPILIFDLFEIPLE